MNNLEKMRDLLIDCMIRDKIHGKKMAKWREYLNDAYTRLPSVVTDEGKWLVDHIGTVLGEIEEWIQENDTGGAK